MQKFFFSLLLLFPIPLLAYWDDGNFGRMPPRPDAPENIRVEIRNHSGGSPSYRLYTYSIINSPETETGGQKVQSIAFEANGSVTIEVINPRSHLHSTRGRTGFITRPSIEAFNRGLRDPRFAIEPQDIERMRRMYFGNDPRTFSRASENTVVFHADMSWDYPLKDAVLHSPEPELHAQKIMLMQQSSNDSVRESLISALTAEMFRYLEVIGPPIIPRFVYLTVPQMAKFIRGSGVEVTYGEYTRAKSGFVDPRAYRGPERGFVWEQGHLKDVRVSCQEMVNPPLPLPDNPDDELDY